MEVRLVKATLQENEGAYAARESILCNGLTGATDAPGTCGPLDEEQGGKILPQGELLVLLYTSPRFHKKEQSGTKSISMQALSQYISHLFCIFFQRVT